MRRHTRASVVGLRQVIRRGSNRPPLALLVLLTLGLLPVLGTSSAYGYGKVVTGSFSTAAAGGLAGRINGLAVDESSGDLYAYDKDRAQIIRFDADGAFISALGAAGSGNGEFNDAGNPAVDQADGSLYVADAGNNRIQKFDSSGNFLFALGADVDPGGGTGFEVCAAPTTCQAGTTGSGDGEFNGIGGLAVGPGGNVFVSDSGNNRIQKFDSTGNFLFQFGIAGSGDGELAGPGSIGVDSTGDIYVGDSTVRVQRFDGAGAFEAVLPVLPILGGKFAIDQSANHLYWTQGSQFDSESKSVGEIREYDSDGVLVDTHGIGAGLLGGSGVTINSSASRLYSAYNYLVSILDDVQPPDVSILPATDVGAHSATVRGTVNPHGTPNNYRFEYSKDGLDWSIGPEGDAGSGSADLPVSGELKLLDPNTLYHVRIAAKPTGGGDFVRSADVTFSTVGIAPDILASPAADVGDSIATLHGRLVANNSPTTYRFEYGPTPAYGSSLPVPDGDAGSGTEPVDLTESLSGLSPATSYHYRIVATNAFGTSTGPDRVLITKPIGPPHEGLPDGRVYEKVTPADKNGADIERRSELQLAHFMTQAATTGDAVVYASKGNVGGDAGTLFPQYIAKRGPLGWRSHGLTPRVDPAPLALGYGYYEWFSDDLSVGAASVLATLHPGGPETKDEGAAWLYLRDTANPNDDANSAFKLLTEPATPIDPGPFVQAKAADMSGDGRLVTDSLLQLTTDGPSHRSSGVYEVQDQAKLVSVGSDGSAIAPSGVGSGRLLAHEYPGDNVISDDGSRVFFTQNGSDPFKGKIYVREDGQETVDIGPGAFQGAKASDGSLAFFTSLDRLTSDATAREVNGVDSDCGASSVIVPCADLYMWNANAAPGEELLDLTTQDPDGGGVLGTIGISDDATRVYFVATGDLAPGAVMGEPNIYLWETGQGIRYIATATFSDSLWQRGLAGAFVQETGNGGYGGYRVTADGQTLLFESRGKITSYDTNGTLQVYLYSLDADEVTCISCNRRSTKAVSDAAFSLVRVSRDLDASYGVGDPTLFLPRNLSADGNRVFFDSVEALLPSDTNGRADVYEWENGDLHLISTGDSGSDSTFIGASDDGNDVFVATREPLARSDKDELVDIYDARVGGVEEPAPIPGCVGDECQGTPTTPPRFDDPGSAGFAGAGNPPPKSDRRCSKSAKRSRSKKQAAKCRKRGRGAKSHSKAGGNQR